MFSKEGREPEFRNYKYEIDEQMKKRPECG